MSVGRRVAWLVAGTVVGAGLTLPVAPAAYAEEGACSEIQDDTADVDEVKAPSLPLEELGIEQATELLERRGTEPGEDVGVAVVDSGVADDAPITQAGSFQAPGFSTSTADSYYHGTAVAGLIAGDPRPDGGAVGIAPAAEIIDVRVYDAPEDSDDGELGGLTDAGVIAGLNWVADNARSGSVPIRIVNVSLALQPSPQLEAAVKRLDKKGIVVVAAAGNRPTDEDDPLLGDFAGEPRPGEDAARVVFPAGYDSVVAATTSVPRGVDARDFIVQNSATDIAVPTSEGVSYSLNKVSCLLPPEAATSWAAAEISGVLALLMSAYDEPADRTVARLFRSATGAGDVTTRLTGHGVAQPVEALERPLAFDDNDVPETSETNNTVLKAEAPRPEADVLADTREDAVWWGLAGGGALVVAMLLRPVLARRRTDDR
ncbi:MAG TPA: S8 family serine peptidase [Nocardioides sp.]|nr:S8 family serine peptidase [Nocardioides sp.]